MGRVRCAPDGEASVAVLHAHDVTEHAVSPSKNSKVKKLICM